jgi:preprotein translocase subunit SecD
MIYKHLLSIGLFLAVVGSSMPATVVVADQISPEPQTLATSNFTLVFRLQQASGTAMSQNMKITIQVFQKRLTALGYAKAVVTGRANNVMVKLPGTENSIDTKAIAQSLMTSSKLTFAEQKIGTEESLRQLRQEHAVITTAIRKLATRSEPVDVARKDYQNKLRRVNTKILRLFKSAEITDRHVIEAQAGKDPMITDAKISVELKFDNIGAQRFSTLTKKLAGTGRSIGIFVNDEILSYPLVDAQYAATGIRGGRTFINGNFTKAEAESLALSLNSGKLPAPLKFLGTNNISGY